MSHHFKNDGSQIAYHASPSRTMQEVSELSREQAAKKLYEKKIQELEYKIKQCEVVIQRQQSQLNDATLEASKVGRQFQDALNDLNQLRQSSEKKDQQIGMLLEENEKVVKVLEKLKQDQKIINGDQIKTIQTLEQQVRDRYQTEKRMNDEIQEKKFQIENLQLQLQQQQNEYEAIANDLKEKLIVSEKQWSTDASLGHLARKRGKQIESLTHTNNEQQLKIQELQNKVSMLLEQNNNLQNTIQKDCNRVEEFKILIKQTEERHREQLERQNDMNEQKIEKLKQQHLVEMQNKMDKLEVIKVDINQKVNQNMKNSTQPIIQELKSARQTINNLQQEVQKLKLSQYKSLQGEAENIQQEFEQLNKKNNQLNEQNFLLQQKLKKEELSNKSKIAELENANEKLQSIQQLNETKIDELQQKLKELPRFRERSLENIKFHVDSTKQTCELETQIRKLKDKNEQMNQEIKEKDQRINSLLDQVKQAQYEKENEVSLIRLESTQEIRETQEQMKRELQMQQKLFNDAQKPFQDQMREAAIDQQKLKQQLQRQQNDIKSLEARIANLINENQQLRNQQDQQRLLEDQLMKEKYSLEHKLQERQKELENWKDKFVKSTNSFEKQTERAEREQNRAEGLRIEVSRIQKQLEQMAEQNNILELKLQNSQQESRVLKNQLVEGLRKDCGSGTKSNGFIKTK